MPCAPRPSRGTPSSPVDRRRPDGPTLIAARRQSPRPARRDHPSDRLLAGVARPLDGRRRGATMRAMTAAPPSASSVTIDDGPLSLADLCAVARGARLELGPAARARIADSRAVVEAAVDG